VYTQKSVHFFGRACKAFCKKDLKRITGVFKQRVAPDFARFRPISSVGAAAVGNGDLGPVPAPLGDYQDIGVELPTQKPGEWVKRDQSAHRVRHR
jgi:hypothetical protein